MRIAIVGSRTFKNYNLLTDIMHRFTGEISNIISGGAKGADSLGEEYANFWQIKFTVFRPNWTRHGKSAGFVRNQQIVNACDMVIAFWDGISKGTKDTIDKARVAKKPTFIIYF